MSPSNAISSVAYLAFSGIRGDALCIKIAQDDYVERIEACKRDLHGRLVLNKGGKPYATKDIMGKLTKQWKTVEKWKLLLGRGYYEFSFASFEDLCSVWAMGMANMKLGVLRLF